jgi:phosphoglycolate phosphatase-like HAD superfamily hydrolase
MTIAPFCGMKLDPLPSWREGASKRAILNFVSLITQTGATDYVPPEARVAVFDNDGTLWCEKPLPIQADFLLRKIGEMTKEDPSLKSRQPWKAVVEKDYTWLSGAITHHYQGDDRDLNEMAEGLLEAYEGSTIEEFEVKASEFLRSAQHPTLRRSYLQCTYQPMVELLKLLEANGFSNYIASGGGRDFMRPVTQSLYGVPPERVIGSSVSLKFEDQDEYTEIVHRPDLDIFDDGPTKPLHIWSRIGRRPIFAAGNSNGDIQMLRFCAHPSRPSMSLLIDHDDADREFSYQTGAEKALELAHQKGWVVASIERDWEKVFIESTQRKERPHGKEPKVRTA